MAKSKLKISRDRDISGNNVILIERRHGDITMEEIRDALLYDSRWRGAYAIIIRAREDMCAAPSMFSDTEGDCVELYPLEAGEACPVCRETLVLDVCPECGAELRRDEVLTQRRITALQYAIKHLPDSAAHTDRVLRDLLKELQRSPVVAATEDQKN